MTGTVRAILVAVLVLAGAPAGADEEASNVAHVAAGTYGRCYARSVPQHVYDPDDARQLGMTEVFRVADGGDVLVHRYDWFSQRIFVLCGPGDDIAVVRTGPWQRGRDPEPGHLAIAFYRGGRLLRSYSTLDIAGDEPAPPGAFSRYANVSASVSHYTVFAEGPELARVETVDGAIFADHWRVVATTVDGRVLTFDPQTGNIIEAPE